MTEELIQITELAIRRFAESHPRPAHVTKAQAAEMLEISTPTLAKLIKAGTIRLNACGLVPISEVDRALAVDRS